MFDDQSGRFSLPVMRKRASKRTSRALISLVSRLVTDEKFGRAYLLVINSGTDRNSPKWLRSLSPSFIPSLPLCLSPPLSASPFSRSVISQKVTTSCATRLSSLTILATHRTDGSRHGVTPGVIAFSAVHPADRQIRRLSRPCTTRPNFKPPRARLFVRAG